MRTPQEIRQNVVDRAPASPRLGPPPLATRIAHISVTATTVVWCPGHHCRYPNTRSRVGPRPWFLT
jgi:hypothetical protein